MLLDRKIWSIASGKGGTGKTVISAGIAVHLADLGFKVALVDLDLGCANLHTCFGVERPKATLSDFIERRAEHVEEVAVDTNVTNLRLICGAIDPIDAAQIKYQQKRRIIRQLNTLEADLVILDIATGSGLTQIELFCASDLGALVVLPEPPSIENAYRLLRMFYFHQIREIPGWKKFEKSLGDDAMDDFTSPVSFLKKVEEKDPRWSDRIKSRLETFTPGFIVNMARAKEDRDLGADISLVCRRYFGINAPFLGAVEYDDCVWQAVKHKKPVMLDYPHSRPSRSIRQITETLLSLSRRRT